MSKFLIKLYVKLQPLLAGGLVFLYKVGLIQAWYRLYRWLYERKYYTRSSRLYTQIDRYPSMTALVAKIQTLTWIPDRVKELYDAMSCAEAIQYRINNVTGKIGDCDEFAVYQAAVINNELGHNPRWYADQGYVMRAYVLTVTWVKTGGPTWAGNPLGLGGHNVCLIRLANGRYQWMDYNGPHNAESVADAARQVRDAYAIQWKPLAWAVLDTDMRLVSVNKA